MSRNVSAPLYNRRSGHLVLGVSVRTLGAFPSGWRMPGAHVDPAADAAALTRVAATAEAAALDFLFFGDWLSTAPELALTDPHLIARPDPLSTCAYLAAVTERIGLIGTAATAYTEPYATARTAASIDLLSGGRFGLNLLTGTDSRAAANFSGPMAGAVSAVRSEGVEEYVAVLHDLWGSVGSELFAGDQQTGVLIRPEQLRPIDYNGAHYSVRGPLNTLPPVQGRVPLAVAGNAPRLRALAAAQAELYLAAPASLPDAIALRQGVQQQLSSAGRLPGDLKVLAPVLPIVAPTRSEAFELYDRLVELVPLHDDSGHPPAGRTDRSAQSITQLVGLKLSERALGDVVTPGDVDRFNRTGHRLLELTAARSSRFVCTRRPPTYRHLLVAQLVDAPIVVGAAADIADHFETWFSSGAADGFTVLTAFLHEQFDAFVQLVLPELRSRGLYRTSYDGATLREHVGTRPANVSFDDDGA